MTKDRRFKHRVRRRMRETGQTYAAALAAEFETRPPPRRAAFHQDPTTNREITAMNKPAVVTRLRGLWMGVSDFDRSRVFYERLGAHFDLNPIEGMMHATLGGTRLNFEPGSGSSNGTGPFLLFDVTDADELYATLAEAGCTAEAPPKDEPWGRQFNVVDPDGHSIAFIGPIVKG